ncbi:recombinase family protein [Metabacillus arenae]|uniref:Recombinase family protein n=1 Tax=Metabacillus arenae TaxID=2771434 RepID=A0A926RV32_9BACI|nr:recombinase family protein [Metabacillus arenae]MBD1379248.1 recombinase family protein [Metabacillus arenae]
MSSTTKKKYALYLRISREHGENEDTLKNHREVLTEFAKREGMEYDIYEEIVSGMKQDISEREEFHKIFTNAENYAGIIVLKLDRLARHETVAMQFKDLCIDYELPIITPTKTYDLKNQSDAMLYSLEAIFSATEGKSIAYRNKLNKIIRARRGEWISSKPAFGYRRNKETKKLEIYEPEAEIVRYIFKLHSQGYGSFKIRDILNEEGYKPQRSDYWNLPSIKRIIKNEVYKGTVVFLDRKRVKRKDKYTHETVEEIKFENAHPAIITVDEWNRANQDRINRAYSANQVREKPAVKSGVTILKDILYCGNCGRKLSIRKDNKSSVGYTIKRCEYLIDKGDKCPNRGMKLEILEKEVLKRLKEKREKLSDAIQQFEINGNEEVKKELEQRVKQIEKKLTEIKSQEKNLIDIAVSGIFTREELKEKKEEIENNKHYYEGKVKQYRGEIESIDMKDTINKYQEVINLIDRISELKKPEEINQTLKRFIKKVSYLRIMPEEVLKLSSQNDIRKGYPYKCHIEFDD